MDIVKKSSLYRWVLLFFLSVYVLTAGGHYYSSDGETIYLVTRSLVRYGTFFIKTTSGYPFKIAVKFGLGHQAAAVTMPAQSVLMTPLYLVGLAVSRLTEPRFTNYLLHLSTSFFNSLVTALMVMVFFLFLRKLGYEKKSSLAATLIFGLATLVWPYSKFDFSESLLALFLLTAIYFSFLFKADGKSYHAFFAGSFLGLAEATKVAAIIVIIPVGLYFLWTLYERRRDRQLNKQATAFIFLSLGLLLFFAVLPGYNLLRYGSLFRTGYGHVKMNTPILTGLYGLLFSTGKGLIFYSTPFLLFFFGLRSFYRHHRAETVLIITIILTTIVFYAKFQFWHGDVAWGPRYLVYLIPLFLLPAVEVVRAFKEYRLFTKALIVFIIGFGVYAQLIGVSAFYNTHLTEVQLQYPKEVGPKNMNKFRFSPKFSPLLLETKTIYRDYHTWREMLRLGRYHPVPAENTKIFNWFIKQVPDYWWVYFSLSTLSRKFLFVLLLPLTTLAISGRKLWVQLRR